MSDMQLITTAEKPQVMGILNVTPDSFSDGGRFYHLEAAFTHAREMVKAGADIIDIGGESTRPQAKPVSVNEELDRVIPVVEKIAAELPVKISVDTSKTKVMEAAIAHGATMINDIAALRYNDALTTIAHYKKIKICLMHMQGTPLTMQNNPVYQNVVQEVKIFLQTRIQACLDAGILEENIIIDPGFGFGKTTVHNLTLMKNLSTFNDLGYPLLIGVSRKSLIGQVLDKPAPDRLSGGLALTALAIAQGAKIIRTHDVAETVDVVKMTYAVINA